MFCLRRGSSWGELHCPFPSRSSWRKHLPQVLLWEKQSSEHYGERRGRNCFRCWSRCFPAADGGLHARAAGDFLKELQPTERSQRRSKFVLKDCSHGGAGEKREEDRTIKEAVPEWLHTPFLFLLCCFRLWGSRGVEDEDVKLSLGKEWGCGGKVLFQFVFVSNYLNIF